MNRLRDFYNHKLQQEAKKVNRSLVEFETYPEWLERNNLSEEADDCGEYGDNEPIWLNCEVLNVIEN